MRRLTQSIPSLLLVVLLLGACSAPAPQNTPTAPSLSPTTLPTPTMSFSPTSTTVPASASRAPTAVPATASPSPTPKPTVLRVVYFKGGYVTLWTEGKGARQLADAHFGPEQLRISDDGQMVAYLGRNSLGNYEILAVNADGTHQRLLVGQDYLRNIPSVERIVSLDFAPASHTLYFVTDQYDLHRVNPDSGVPTPVFGAGTGGFFSFSPDGRWMTLYHPRELVLARSDGSAARVVYEWLPDYGVGAMGPEIIWKPDSSGFHLVAASGPQGSPDCMTAWFIPVVGKPARQMSYSPYGENLSPDGRKVVSLYYPHEPIDVHVITADGKDTTYDSYANVSFMGWAPDSKHFLLDLSKDGRVRVPYLCAVGEQPVKLTDTDNASFVVWVDAQRVLFVSYGAPAGDALRLQRVGAPSILLDTVHDSRFDYTLISP